MRQSVLMVLLLDVVLVRVWRDAMDVAVVVGFIVEFTELRLRCGLQQDGRCGHRHRISVVTGETRAIRANENELLYIGPT